MSRAFANLDGLMRLSRKDGIDIRPALLRVITDLFVQEETHTREEVQQYAELSLRLLPVVDEQTRAAVIAKLTVFSGAPAWLLDELGRLPQATDVAAAGEPVEALIGAAVTDAIPPARGAIAAPPTETAKTGIGERFLRLASAERQAMLLHLDETETLAREPSWFRSRPRMVERLEAAAQEHDPREFARELQQSFGLSTRIAGAIVHDDGGEPLVVVARASGMQDDALLRVLLLLNPAIGESVERVFSLYRLYPRIGLAAVAPIMASWREESRARPTARYQPLHAPEEAAGRTGAWDSFRTATESQRERGATRPVAGAAPAARRQGTT
jgi:hypothetical protein